MFEVNLKKYKINGQFSLKISESLQKKCNAPTDKNGVYLIYKVINSIETLIYIGSSGRLVNSKLTTRKSGLGGMKDRLINGYHPNRFGQTERIKRHKSFLQQMQIEKIHELRFYWWVTFNEDNSDFPTHVETTLRKKYLDNFKRLPEWHKQR